MIPLWLPSSPSYCWVSLSHSLYTPMRHQEAWWSWILIPDVTGVCTSTYCICPDNANSNVPSTEHMRVFEPICYLLTSAVSQQPWPHNHMRIKVPLWSNVIRNRFLPVSQGTQSHIQPALQQQQPNLVRLLWFPRVFCQESCAKLKLFLSEIIGAVF